MGEPRLALDRLRVLDFSQHATGPFATQIMAALGASVVKVEQPSDGDRERFTEPQMFLACNRGKRSIAVAAELNERIGAAIGQATLAEWRPRLDAAGIAYAPVLHPSEVFTHPQVQALGVVHQAPSPYADLPIFGLASRSLVRPPEVDEHGRHAAQRRMAGD